MLRQKTLLGETYVELTQGDERRPEASPRTARCRAAQVAESVQLDEIFRTFDERTRAAFQTWMQQAALAFAGRGADFSAAIANLEPFAEDANRRAARARHPGAGASSSSSRTPAWSSTRSSERQGQLRGLIQNSATVFATTARRNQDLRRRSGPADLPRRVAADPGPARDLLADTNPLITQLRPVRAGAERRPAARPRGSPRTSRASSSASASSPSARRTGLPALRALLNNDLPPLLTQFTPFLRQVTPIITAAPATSARSPRSSATSPGATQATVRSPETGGPPAHYLRVGEPADARGLRRLSTNRLQTNRNNPYAMPGWSDSWRGACRLRDQRNCAGRRQRHAATRDTGQPHLHRARQPGPDSTPADLFDRIQEFGFSVGHDHRPAAARAACTQQPAVSSIGQVAEVDRLPARLPGRP